MQSSTHEPLRGTARGVSVGFRLLPLAIAVVWACTALPVEIPPSTVDFRIWRFGVGDLLANIGLYVPLGVALRRRGLLLAIVVGAGLSVTVEILQIFYLDRYSAAADVLANTVGAGAGWIVSQRRCGLWASAVDPIPLTRRLVAVAASGFAVAVVYLSVPGPRPDFANWDPACRFIVADELTRDRPWSGSIEALAVFDRALGWGEVERLSRRGGRPLESLSPLYLAGPLEPLASIRGEPLLDEREQKRFHERLVSAGQMSVFVRFATRDESQSGPARIAGCSKSTLDQNFSLGQENREIIFRLRTRTTVPGGFFPQTKTRPVLVKDRSTSVAATYDGRNVRVFADGRCEARLNLSAHGRLSPFLSDSGLPASASFVGVLMGVVCVGLAGGAGSRLRLVLAGGLGGIAGGFILLAAGGAASFPEFAPWLPVLSVWGGAVAGGSVVGPADEWGPADARGALGEDIGARR